MFKAWGITISGLADRLGFFFFWFWAPTPGSHLVVVVGGPQSLHQRTYHSSFCLSLFLGWLGFAIDKLG